MAWLVGTAVFIVSVWGKLRDIHARIHDLEKRGVESEAQISAVSRIVCRSEARVRVPNWDDHLKLTAQHGEELFLWDLCDFKRNGYFVEIGAYNGISLSNSWFFENIGWTGILVEAHPELAVLSKENRPQSRVIQAALGEEDTGIATFSMVRGRQGLDALSFVETDVSHLKRIERRGGTIEVAQVQKRTLTSLLDELRPNSIDWISIDVEGSELQVLKGTDLNKYGPRVLMIEANSLNAEGMLSRYLAVFGYVLEKKIGCNCIFVRQ